MKQSNLKTVDELSLGVEYIKFIDEDELKELAERTYFMYNNIGINNIDPALRYDIFYSTYIIKKIINHDSTPKSYKYVIYLGEYDRRFYERNISDINKFIWFYRKDIDNIITMYRSDKTRKYQSLADWEKDLKKWGEIQKDALSLAMTRGIGNKLLNEDVSSIISSYLPHADEIKYPTDETEYVPIFKKEIEKQIKKQIEEKFKNWNAKHSNMVRLKWANAKANANTENDLIRSSSLDNNNKVKPTPTPTHRRSLPNMHEHKEDEIEDEDAAIRDEDIIPNQTHNKTRKTTSIINKLRNIFSNWQNSRSRRSRVYTVNTGGKRKTNRRNHKKTKKTRKTKRHR